MRRFAFALFVLCTACQAPQLSSRHRYPREWWQPVPQKEAASWEVLPQEAGPGEVILSKRNELGLLSNFAATPFTFEGETYASVEGFWQMMKFPDSLIADDPRKAPQFVWTNTREGVAQLVGFEAKDAGNEGSKVMKELGIDWVSYFGKQMPYHTPEKGEHYDLIRRAMKAKLEQTQGLKELLLKTGDLTLKPDHDQGANPPPAWQYFQIWMEFRSELQSEKSSR
jgi:predicted NAD-dependent protein-ADP-ribosyltransferase YbiA (DUF1768 family)